MIGHNAEFSGKGPKNTLITVEITDTDTSRPIIEHQKFGRVSGSATSDADGDWVFVPQDELVPGKFSVYATYKAQNQTVKSEEVQFTVVDEGGSSGRLSTPTIRRLIIGIGVMLLVIITCIVVLVRRRHHHAESPGRRPEAATGSAPTEQPEASQTQEQPPSLFLRTDAGKNFVEQEQKRMSALDAEAIKIEAELAEAAQQLERTNAEVAQLRQRLVTHSSIPPDSPTKNPKSTKTKNKN